MSKETRRLGIDAVVSFQCKFIHPHRLRDEKFPNPSVGQRLSNALVVRRALKKIKHSPVICVVVHHEAFKDSEGIYQEIWCSENHIRVEKEGDPELFFKEHQLKRQVDTKGIDALENDSKKTEESENETFTAQGLVGDEVDDSKNEIPMATFSEVFYFAKSPKSKIYLSIGLFASILSGVVQPAIAIVFAQVFAKFADGVDSSGVRLMVNWLLIIGAYAFLTMTMQSTFLETAAAEMTDTMKREWVDALLRQDIAYYDEMDISGTVTIINRNGMKFRRGLSRKMGDGIQFSITALGGLVFGFWCSLKLSLILIAIVPIIGAATSLVMKLNQTKALKANKSYEKAGSIVYSSASSIRTILSLNAVEEVIEKFEEATHQAYLGATKHVLYLGAANGAVLAVFIFAYVPLTLYGSYLLYTDVGETGCDPSGTIESNRCSITAFEVFGSLLGITFAGAAMPLISAGWESFIDARSACYPALTAINRKSLREEQSKEYLSSYVIDSTSLDSLEPKPVEGHIRFQDVSFRYPTRLGTSIFIGLNLDIKPGTTVALCGPSGERKGAAIQLLERFYDPSSGSIILDGTNLRNLNTQWLRKQIGLVSQEPELFAMSVGDNIKVGRPNATFQEIRAAAKRANAHEFIQSFPEGYDTMVGEEGSELSGGQKQRKSTSGFIRALYFVYFRQRENSLYDKNISTFEVIAIARALIMKPRIILLDEATSALDSESEATVQHALDKLIAENEGRSTIIVVAQRLSTIKNADMIAVLLGGSVVEKGKHAELIAKRGVYYGLINAQNGKEREGSDEVWKSAAIAKTPVPARAAISSNTDDIITFQEVYFKYPFRTGDNIFDGLNMSIKKGEKLAIVVPSGQGKSAVIELIEQFYLPDKGCVLYNGTSMTDLNVAWLRSQMSLVSQEPILYDISIKENIRFGLATATEKDIEKAAKEANCHDFITSFPDGYDTVVGLTGKTQVSGGQKQCIVIARALLRNPKILLLDKATSLLDSESERIVQSTLDKIITNRNHAVVEIAHKISTIRNFDRIVVLEDGKIRESGTHEQLMASKGRYHRLVDLQNLDNDFEQPAHTESLKADTLSDSLTNSQMFTDNPTFRTVEGLELSMANHKSNAKKALSLAKEDLSYFLIGGIGALFAGLIFPGWGFTFALMVELIYFNPVFPCDEPDGVSPFNSTCQEYWDETREKMRDLSFDVTYIFLALMLFALLGNVLLSYGFGTATERVNKRVRDMSFNCLVRQEVAYFDKRPVSVIMSQLNDDAAMIHSFSGEPIRAFIMNLASVFVGLVLSFFFMWPFALVALGVLPFMAFGAEAEQRMYMGENETTDEDKKNSEIILIESLANIRTVASLSLEASRSEQYAKSLQREDPTPLWTNFRKGASTGLGPLFQEWSFALLFWWGSWLVANHPNLYSNRGFIMSMFSLFFSLSGMAAATQGATDRPSALSAAERTFALIERESQIDPLSLEGKKNV